MQIKQNALQMSFKLWASNLNRTGEKHQWTDYPKVYLKICKIYDNNSLSMLDFAGSFCSQHTSRNQH